MSLATDCFKDSLLVVRSIRFISEIRFGAWLKLRIQPKL